MNDRSDKARAQLIEAALPHIAFDGWDMKVLEQAALELGKPKLEAQRLFPEGSLQAISFFSRMADEKLEETLTNDYALSEMKIRERIATAVMVRLRTNLPHREAVRRALGVLMLPWNSPTSMQLLYETVDVMWRCAGDTSTDHNFYTKRLLLSKVYMSTLYVWLNDDTPELSETEAFLHRRIEDVMQIQKWKAKLSNPADFFAGVNPFTQKQKA